MLLAAQSMKLSTLTIILYGSYVLALTLGTYNPVTSLVRTLFVHGDYDHNEAAALLLLSPVLVYAIGRFAVRLSNRFTEWHNRRKEHRPR